MEVQHIVILFVKIINIMIIIIIIMIMIIIKFPGCLSIDMVVYDCKLSSGSSGQLRVMMMMTL